MPYRLKGEFRGMGQYSTVAQTIQTLEGWFPGSISSNNNNPGNLMYAGQPGATGADANGFAVFPTFDAGMQALENQISLDASRGETIQQFASKYAPASAGNDPVSYAASIASATGLSVNDPLAAAADTSSGSSPALLPTGGTTDTGSYTDSTDWTMLYVGLGLVGAAVAVYTLSN